MRRPFPWKCRKCGLRQANPTALDYTAEMDHDGRSYTVTVPQLEVIECGACHARLLPDESLEKLNNALRTEIGLLMPSEILEKRQALGLSQRDFAKLLGVAPATVSRWETGGQFQQRVMDEFMRAFFGLPALRDYLRCRRGVSVPMADPA